MRQVDKILIGQLSVDSKADWETLQNMISNIFKVSIRRYLRLELYLFCLNLTDQRSCLLRKSSIVLNSCERHPQRYWCTLTKTFRLLSFHFAILFQSLID